MNNTYANFVTYFVAACSLAIEEMVTHPIGTIVSIVGLLYAYDRWRTQRIVLKIKKEELKKLEDERRIRFIEEHSERPKD